MDAYCEIQQEDRRAYQNVLQYAFSPEAGPTGLRSRMGSGRRGSPTHRGYYVDGELASTCTLYHPDARFRGDWTTIGGSTGYQHDRLGAATATLASC